ncbi:MAG: metallophosphoesterase family protein [bacterium]|nr:metallophosphoesterase family protein [bacterium]
MRQALVLLLIVVSIGAAQQQRRRRDRPEIFHTEVPAQTFNIILGRPTAGAVTASVLAYEPLEGYFEVGDSLKTGAVLFEQGEPREVLLEGLAPDTAYAYRFRYRQRGAPEFASSEEYRFHTRRAPGSRFTFTVQADSHLDERTSPEIYRRTLEHALAAEPDFHIDLGDTFMTDKRRGDFREARPQYLAQRYYFGLLCHSVPLFLVLGNHDGEAGFRNREMGAWSARMRRRFFPSASAKDYYAWTWGDALFVALDPYWPTKSRRGRDGNWTWTLGEEQYRWLGKTLAQSDVRFRFVFIHHLVGGLDRSSRGGAGAAPYFEWGGKNPDGSDGFASHRPGWELPIHDLLVKHNVSVVFHGHDHMFAREELDGVIYQLVPQPGHSRGSTRSAAEYGYTNGEVLPSPGHVRVEVAPGEARVKYIRTEGGGARNAYSYAVRSQN